MKPGPAISTRATSSLAGSAATSACASARGLVRAALASSIAALVAKSPCSRVLGRSTTKSGGAASAGTVPAARSASMPWAIRALRRVFTRGGGFMRSGRAFYPLRRVRTGGRDGGGASAPGAAAIAASRATVFMLRAVPAAAAGIRSFESAMPVP